jgi:hypothetical protein
MADIAIKAAEALKSNSRRKLASLQRLEDTRAEFRQNVEKNLSYLPDFDPAEAVRQAKVSHIPPKESFKAEGGGEFWTPRVPAFDNPEDDSSIWVRSRKPTKGEFRIVSRPISKKGSRTAKVRFGARPSVYTRKFER